MQINNNIKYLGIGNLFIARKRINYFDNKININTFAAHKNKISSVMTTKTKTNKNESVVLNDYESVIIFTPVLSEEQLKDAVTKYRNLITENGGEMVHEENWGLTKLAYPIQKKTTGFYHVYEFRATADFISKFELAFRRDERIMRFLTVALNKHAVVYNTRKRNGEFKKQKEKKQEGTK